MNWEEKLKDLLIKTFKDKQCRIYLFGSRSRNDHRENSDYDIAILCDPNISIDKELCYLKTYIEEDFNIPYKVDIVDFNSLSIDFRNNILQEGILWN